MSDVDETNAVSRAPRHYGPLRSVDVRSARLASLIGDGQFGRALSGCASANSYDHDRSSGIGSALTMMPEVTPTDAAPFQELRRRGQRRHSTARVHRAKTPAPPRLCPVRGEARSLPDNSDRNDPPIPRENRPMVARSRSTARITHSARGIRAFTAVRITSPPRVVRSPQQIGAMATPS